MKEYQGILDYYSSNEFDWFSKLVLDGDWGDIVVGEQYLEKYWLNEIEYIKIWTPIQNRIFVPDTLGIPEPTFQDGYEMLIFEGGCLFTFETFTKLKKSMLDLGEEYFVVIENSLIENQQEPAFRLKFPVNISWEELTSGNFVSSTFIESIYKEFFVFGQSGFWGKYSAPDYEFPLDVLVFKADVQNVFKFSFNQAKEEQEKLSKWNPNRYK
jgi:hypothetical protein